MPLASSAPGSIILAMSSETWAVVDCQMATTWVYRSSSVMSPRWNCSSMRLICSSALASMAALLGGTGISLTAMVMPPRVAYLKPMLLMPSTRCAVSSEPSVE